LPTFIGNYLHLLQDKYQKFNRVDALVQNSKGELIIIEIQNNQEHDYLLRILFGASILLVKRIRKIYRTAVLRKKPDPIELQGWRD
jgi:hypothetical protein